MPVRDSQGQAAAGKLVRHRWSSPDRPDHYLTHRTCMRCGMVRTTHHEGERFPWVTFRDGEGRDLYYAGTPPCQGSVNTNGSGTVSHGMPQSNCERSA